MSADNEGAAGLPLAPTAGLEKIAGPGKTNHAGVRALISLDALDVECHALLLARMPPDRRELVMRLLGRHPMVLSCRGFTVRSDEIVIEVAGSAQNTVLDFTNWARDRLDIRVREYLPIENVVHGGPEKIPSCEFLTGKPAGSLIPQGSRPARQVSRRPVEAV